MDKNLYEGINAKKAPVFTGMKFDAIWKNPLVKTRTVIESGDYNASFGGKSLEAGIDITPSLTGTGAAGDGSIKAAAGTGFVTDANNAFTTAGVKTFQFIYEDVAITTGIDFTVYKLKATGNLSVTDPSGLTATLPAKDKDFEHTIYPLIIEGSNAYAGIIEVTWVDGTGTDHARTDINEYFLVGDFTATPDATGWSDTANCNGSSYQNRRSNFG